MEIFEPSLAKSYVLGHSFIVLNGQILNNHCNHLVTLSKKNRCLSRLCVTMHWSSSMQALIGHKQVELQISESVPDNEFGLLCPV